jgi:DNA-binding transcriptional MerR regulator
MNSDDLMTSRQVAEATGKTISTVNRWVDEGKLQPAMTLPGYNGARLFARSAVEQVVQ